MTKLVIAGFVVIIFAVWVAAIVYLHRSEKGTAKSESSGTEAEPEKQQEPDRVMWYDY